MHLFFWLPTFIYTHLLGYGLPGPDMRCDSLGGSRELADTSFTLSEWLSNIRTRKMPFTIKDRHTRNLRLSLECMPILNITLHRSTFIRSTFSVAE